MSKFTQGKWDWRLTEDRVEITVDGQELHPTIDDVRLITAAPMLYGILKDLTVMHDSYPEWTRELYSRASKLIADIDGEKESSNE